MLADFHEKRLEIYKDVLEKIADKSEKIFATYKESRREFSDLIVRSFLLKTLKKSKT